MKYEVYVDKITSASFIIEAGDIAEAERKALIAAESSDDFSNDDFPSYEIYDCYESTDFVWED